MVEEICVEAATLPPEIDSDFDSAPVLASRLTELAATQPHVGAALETIDAALRLYGPSRLVLSFNGGKDATLLLHLARGVYSRAGAGSPRCVYWHEADGFAEVHAFVEATAERLGLVLERYTCSFAEGMRDAVERLGVAAVLLGTRGCDPNGAGAQAFQPSSAGWPAFMRVNPLLRWSYHHVWRALRTLRLPYCTLYDRGYTSLGSVPNTRPNPALLRPDGAYDPAHALLQPALERGGRGTQVQAAGVALVLLDVSPALARELLSLAAGGAARSVLMPPAMLSQLLALVKASEPEQDGL
jgi:FAD synthetase